MYTQVAIPALNSSMPKVKSLTGCSEPGRTTTVGAGNIRPSPPWWDPTTP